MKLKRCSFLYAIIKAAKESGKIVVPTEWLENLDFETDFVKDISSNLENENHRLKRGFIYNVYPPENQLAANKGLTFTWYKDSYNAPKYWTENSTASNPQDYFLNFIRMVLGYPREEFYKKYPQEQYPLISKQYEELLVYMMNTYGIDLEKIAEGPQE